MNIKKAGYQEVRGKLGIFGWMSRGLLLVWQVAMIGWFVNFSSKVAPMVEAGGASGAGAAIGGGIGVTLILIVWAGGTVVLGIFALLTRRTKAIVPVQPPAEG